MESRLMTDGEFGLVSQLKRDTYLALPEVERRFIFNLTSAGALGSYHVFRANMKWLDEWEDVGGYGDALWWQVWHETDHFARMRRVLCSLETFMLNWELGTDDTDVEDF